MRLHTSLTDNEVMATLVRAKGAGHVTANIGFAGWGRHGSRSHARAFEIQLGTWDKNSLPAGYTDQRGRTMNVRKYANSGHARADAVYAATWREWGWFMAEVFAADPSAKFGPYDGRCDFNNKTHGEFCKEDA